eukprot:25119-Pyramimonas_sp.AAC.1
MNEGMKTASRFGPLRRPLQMAGCGEVFASPAALCFAGPSSTLIATDCKMVADIWMYGFMNILVSCGFAY